MYGDRDNNQGNDAGKFQLPNTGCRDIADDNNAEAEIKHNKKSTFDNKKIAQNLIKLRESSKPIKARYKISQFCGLHSDALRRYERGEAIPTIDMLIKLADYYDVTIDYLVGREKNENSPYKGNFSKKHY